MAGAFDHYAAVGYPVPAFVNPADYYLDMVSPGYKLQQSDKFAEWWKTKGDPKQAAAADAALAKGGKTASELIQEVEGMASKALGKGHLTEHSYFESDRYKVSYKKMTSVLITRELKLLLRDPTRLAAELFMNVAVAVVLGIAFQGVGKKPPQNQMGAFAMILQLSFITTMVGVPLMDVPKLVVKMESSDNLYSIAI